VSSTSDTRDVIVPAPPTHPSSRLTLCRPRPSSLSSLAVFKSPFAPNHADITLLPGARHKFAPPSFLSAACHARRTRHLVHRSSLASIHSAGHLAMYGFIHGPLRMFRLSFFILDPLPLSLASPSPPLPLDIDFCRSFRPCARCRASISYLLLLL
jgi:hypothetical protein